MNGPKGAANIASADEARPPANFPMQAVVVIHGMGEQMPMDTIRSFVSAELLPVSWTPS